MSNILRAVALSFVSLTVIACSASNVEPAAPSTPSCPQGSNWDGSHCVGQEVQCPTGTTWSGSSCVPNGSTAQAGQGQGTAAPAEVANFYCISFTDTFSGAPHESSLCRSTEADCEDAKQTQITLNSVLHGGCRTQSTSTCIKTDTGWGCYANARDCKEDGQYVVELGGKILAQCAEFARFPPGG